MSLGTRYYGIACIHHNSLDALKGILHAAPVWFAVPERPFALDWEAILQERVEIHRFGEAQCMIIKELCYADIDVLSRICASAFINYPSVLISDGASRDVASSLAQSGFKLFFPHGKKTIAGHTYAAISNIGSMEFLLSSSQRLRNYPTIKSPHSARLGVGRAGTRQRRSLFLLDLIQDIEILTPFINKAIQPESGLDVVVSVSKRILKSLNWPALKLFLEVNHIAYVTPAEPSELITLLGYDKALLITASESTAAGHCFAHDLCLIAPAKTMRITMQHGYECIGLRHHLAHDKQFPEGVRFASDHVLTWQQAAELPNLHPMERDKITAVGITKSYAQRAALLSESEWQADSSNVLKEKGHKLLIAENLHSTRFQQCLPRYQRFYNFIMNSQENSLLDVMIRSHPGKRTLEREKENNGLEFLEGELTPDAFAQFDGFVSPPSTIVLDAVLAGVNSMVWSDAKEIGDVENYRGLSIVTDSEDILLGDQKQSDAQKISALKWAVDNTSACNGVSHAWNVIEQLAA